MVQRFHEIFVHNLFKIEKTLRVVEIPVKNLYNFKTIKMEREKSSL